MRTLKSDSKCDKQSALKCREAMENAILRGAVCIPKNVKNVERYILPKESFNEVRINGVKMYQPTRIFKGSDRRKNGGNALRKIGERIEKERNAKTGLKALKYFFGSAAVVTVFVGGRSLYRGIFG